MSWQARILTLLYNPFTPRWLDRSVLDYLYQLPEEAVILNLGSGSANLREGVINMDVKQYPNVSLIADGMHLPFRDSCFDCIFCNAVLEHVERPWLVAEEISRTLKASGVACIQSPFLEAIHDEHDYFRFTLKGLRSLFPGFDEVKSGVSGSVNQVLADFVRVYPVFMFEKTILEKPVKFVMSWLAKPIQYLDYVLRGKPSMERYARAFYFIGRKR